PAQYTFFLHAPPGARASLHGAEATIRAKAAVASLTAAWEAAVWRLERTPVPVVDYVDLDRKAVLPREALRLDSSSSEKTDFMVAMRFQNGSEIPSPLTPFQTSSGEGFKSLDGSAAVVFRSGSGPLVIQGTHVGSLTSDGDTLAFRQRGGVTDLFAERVRALSTSQNRLFVADPSPVDVIMRQTPKGEKAQINCRVETDLSIYVREQPTAVILDGTMVPLRVHQGFISIPHVRQGEHIVEIEY
ncbi:MAG: hypothetical protein ACRD2G_19605, partial [Terriglobia bacterium]